ncbi:MULTISPECIES: SDR family NAD(P)-dependent oxidoreductase [Sphingomonadales]|jgi:NAD(P)-dependent dehydrogenase (short-subunit alcohol dehydrogenase family)|uniref:Short-chain dehydrogenase/reductase SDR n=1 Tax=Rhizorhabdus wittichii (strain DSM 6014 / CCUG 31198 / JCM 15750 / NBRC 105917 / EY 4224 / RW1) TaxID=392499 RepID=A0A9J9LF21_RHIWR|nr:short-chain dehydrogenase/reductase SDR [Rhizorhabdus wittichii RW1]
MFDFTGKAVLVTGGGAGIGRATAEAFKAAGARVATIEIDPARAEEARAALGDDALVVVGDVTDAAAVADLAAQVDAAFGGLDVLVNNVGDFLMLAKPFDQLSDAEIARLYATNLGQVFGVTRAMIPLLRRKGAGGSIVSVSSIEGFRGIPNCAVYAACKAGLTGFTQSLALELGPGGIRVNLIAPETTDTPQVPVSLMIPEEHRRHIPNWIPLGRFGTPQDMASGILFLASPHAAWITGTALHIDGGALAAAGWYRDPRGTWTNLPVLSGNGLDF